MNINLKHINIRLPLEQKAAPYTNIRLKDINDKSNIFNRKSTHGKIQDFHLVFLNVLCTI